MTKARVITVLVLLLAAAQSVVPRQTGAPPLHRLSLPGQNWALDLDLSAFDLPEGAAASASNPGKGFKPRNVRPVESLSGDGTEYMLAAFHRFEEKKSPSSVGIMIRMTYAPAAVVSNAEALRSFKLKDANRAPMRVTSTKTWEYKQIPVARYSVDFSFDPAHNMGGPSVIPVSKVRTLEAYFVKGNVWITVGLLAPDLGEREEKFFNALLDSVKFVDTSAPSTGFDYYHKGRLLYLLKDYGRATGVLATALEMERRERRLDLASWRDMISLLIDSYGGAGDIALVKETLDYAAASDPANPRFQMALARYNAGLGDLDKIIEHLEKAFRLNATSGHAVTLSDPLRDRAFERFWKDERFRKTVKTLMKVR